MSATILTHDLNPRHTERSVLVPLNSPGNPLVESGPSTAGVELGG